MNESTVRDQIANALGWKDAHATFDDAVADLPPDLRGKQVPGFPHTMWQLLEHIRIAQEDLLEFCRDENYQALNWPDDYWPDSAAPASDEAWQECICRVQTHRVALAAFARDPDVDLTAEIPHGDGQTYLRELLLAADHTAYHVGQMVALRRQLGAWK